MLNLKACAACLSTNVTLISLESGKLREQFYKLTGLQSARYDGLPEFLCFECVGYVKRFIKFRDKCQRAHFTFKELLLQNKEIQKSTLEAINREVIGIAPSLSYLNLDKVHYEQAKFCWVHNNRLSVKHNDDIPIFTYGTLSKEIMFESNKVNGDLTAENLKEDDKDSINIKDFIKFQDDNEDQDLYQQSTSSPAKNRIRTVLDFEVDRYLDSDSDSNILDTANDSNTLDTANDSNTIDEPSKLENSVDGSDLNFEYAIVNPISMKEAKAVVEICTLLCDKKDRFRCDVCNKPYISEKRLKIHQRMHDKYVSGLFECELCHYCYKTDHLLQSHMREKHMFKYICRKCPEVSFDRCTAKQHYLNVHVQNGIRNKSANYQRPDWLDKRGGKRQRNTVQEPETHIKKRRKNPIDFPVYTPISHNEQYELILARKMTKNYLESQYKCELCFKGFRSETTLNTHLKKHDPQISGPLQCDMCKLHFPEKRKMYKHMRMTHVCKYSCQLCNFECFSLGQSITHYKWHKNVIYPCPHCDRKFEKISTQLTHIRIKHPSTNVCSLCGHSFVSVTGLHNHMAISHTKEDVESTKTVTVDKSSPHYCAECDVQFVSATAFDTHLGSSNKHSTINKSIRSLRRTRRNLGPRERVPRTPRPRRSRRSWADIIHNNGEQTPTTCEVCGKFLPNDVQARKHYEAEHPGADYLKRYMCDVCGHTTRQYANLMVHMRTHTRERPYECPHCDRRFSMPSNRDRHIVRPYECPHCDRRFSMPSNRDRHIVVSIRRYE
ncbi:zinc finger protein 271-like [Ostrinia nubilalis]|uniref:zinc finger protein 271-like n=1 Tax=Ostrinia nubilalis TaxID=29057 RepID=UPI00308237AD